MSTSLHSIWKLMLASDKLKVTTSSDCETQALLKSRTRPTTTVQPNGWYRRRGIRSRGAILVLIISVCVNSGALNQLLQSLLKMNKLLRNSQALRFFFYVVFGIALPQLFYPLAGWLADARFGRHRVIQTSLWCVWLGQCALSVAILLFQLLKGHSTAYSCIFVYGLFPVAFIIINVGLAGFQANIIPFGIDQMVDASGDQMSAFIHWYYWSTFIGGAAFSVVLQSLIPVYTLYVLELGINVILASVALLCWYKLKRWLIIEPQCQNPFKTVYDVIKFASKHNRPIYRSALTYWDDTPPSRLDLGKNKYGGPFSTEEVENVKSFFAITAVLLSLGLYIIADNTLATPLMTRMKDIILPYRLFPGKEGYSVGDLASIASQVVPILLVIPACELVIYPLMQNYIPTILKRIGIGMTVAVACNVALIILYVNLYADHEWNYRYCFLLNSTQYANANVPTSLMAIPFTISTFSELLVYIGGLEFICAQSPYSFRGMLFGTFYAIQGLFITIAMLIAVAVAYGYKGTYGCGNAYYPVMLGIATVGFIIYVVVGRRYKGRERDEHIDHHIIAENYYTSRL